MRVALIHDYLKEYGGAERVLEGLHQLFPSAPVYTAYYNKEGLGTHADRIKGWDIRTSWLQKVPFASAAISPLRIFAPMLFESFDLQDYDLVISSCAIYFAKAVITQPESLHISYIHTPPRYLYGYTTSFNYKKNPLTRILGEIANHFLRIYDFETSQRPDILVANSQNVAERIKKFYRREPVVIYPPVDIGKFQTKKERGKYFLSVGRLVRGKGMDMIIEACGKLGLPLKVAGTGPQLESLKSKVQQAKWQNIEFLGQVNDEELPKLYAQAKAIIVASEDEDFGIVPVEAMAAGTPVIAPASGGFLETVLPGKTGVLYPVSKFDGQDQSLLKLLVQALEDFNPDRFRVEDCRKQAQKFSLQQFNDRMLELIRKNLPKNDRPD